MPADRAESDAITPAVLGRFALGAVIWLIPAVLLLPLLLIVAAVSVVAGEGALLEMATKIRGGVLNALGPLLVGCGVAAIVWVSSADAELEDWLNVSLFAALVLGGGLYATRRALRRIAREMRGG